MSFFIKNLKKSVYSVVAFCVNYRQYSAKQSYDDRSPKVFHRKDERRFEYKKSRLNVEDRAE